MNTTEFRAKKAKTARELQVCLATLNKYKLPISHSLNNTIRKLQQQLDK